MPLWEPRTTLDIINFMFSSIESRRPTQGWNSKQMVLLCLERWKALWNQFCELSVFIIKARESSRVLTRGCLAAAEMKEQTRLVR